MATWPHQPERLVPRGDRPSITTHFHFNITCSEDRFPLTSSNLTWTPKKTQITLFTTHPPASIGAFLHRHHLRHYPRCTVQGEKTSRFWYSYDYKKNKSAGEYQHHSGNQKRKRESETRAKQICLRVLPWYWWRLVVRRTEQQMAAVVKDARLPDIFVCCQFHLNHFCVTFTLMNFSILLNLLFLEIQTQEIYYNVAKSDQRTHPQLPTP